MARFVPLICQGARCDRFPSPSPSSSGRCPAHAPGFLKYKPLHTLPNLVCNLSEGSDRGKDVNAVPTSRLHFVSFRPSLSTTRSRQGRGEGFGVHMIHFFCQCVQGGITRGHACTQGAVWWGGYIHHCALFSPLSSILNRLKQLSYYFALLIVRRKAPCRSS